MIDYIKYYYHELLILLRIKKRIPMCETEEFLWMRKHLLILAERNFPEMKSVSHEELLLLRIRNRDD